jgi:hypothetical protein
MQPVRKRLSTDSPKKVQTELTLFTGKRCDTKNTPNRSYAQAASGNRFEVLSDPDDDKDEEMEDNFSTDSSETTPKQGNDKTTVSSKSSSITKYTNPLSKKSQRKMSKAIRKDSHTKTNNKITNNPLLSSATRATLERSRQAKELLTKNTNAEDEESSDTTKDISQGAENNESQATIAEQDKNSKQQNEVSQLEESSSESMPAGHKSSMPEAATSIRNDNQSSMREAATSVRNDNLQPQARVTKNVSNPYTRPQKSSQGILHAIPQRSPLVQNIKPQGSIDKPISLKKGMLQPHIHRYTLRIKIISSKSEEDEQALVQKTLQKLFDIILQGDPKTIIPPFFELDRADNSVPDLLSTFNVAALDSYYSLKRYFSRLSPRSEEGFVWSSIILAQSISFSSFMEKTRHSLENQDFSLWPKALDHELASDVGWLLYSTCQQDKERLADMLSKLTGEMIGVKWKPIHTTDGSNRKKDPNSNRVYALHLESAADKVQEARKKLSKWFGSTSKRFPDGTKMRLVPPFNTVLSLGNKQKYASLITKQSALNSRLGSATTWEFSTNMLLDKNDLKSGRSFREIMMEIPSQVFPGTPLFHTIDKQWRSEDWVIFTFLPENDSDARSIDAGLIPFLRYTADIWYMSLFTAEAKLRHSSSKWDHATRQVFSVEEFEIDEFLAEDNEYNKTDEPTAEKPVRRPVVDESHIQVNVPIVIDPEDNPKMYEDTDSVSTFHPKDGYAPPSVSPSKTFTPTIVLNPPSMLASSTSASKPNNIDYQEDGESVSKLSDTQSRISSMEQDIKHLHTSFQNALAEIKLQTQKQASQQSQHEATLTEILSLLRQSNLSSNAVEVTLDSSARDNPPMQSHPTGGSDGAAGSG